ncbi:MAG: NosD domain-containing protein [Euryarchaeota archaeon]
MHKITAPLLSIVLTCLLVSTLAVSVNGNTLNVGSGGQHKSITEAVNAAQPGDTITISASTYTENVIVTKSVTIRAASPGSTVVTAADPSKDVFLVQSKNVRVEGLTITGGASGVHIQNTSKCVVTNVIARDNVRGVYLSHSTENEISKSNLADNGYGVYGDTASSNTISSNVATGERGSSASLGDGIFLEYGDSNIITLNNLSANHAFGISIHSSPRNVISNNTISDNDLVGIRIGPGSNDNMLTFNTIARNGQTSQTGAQNFPPSGILIVSATGNRIYLNSFVSQSSAVIGASAAILNSPEKTAYTYGGVERTGYLSNYYSDYKGSDTNGTGIGSPASVYGDKYPLVQPFENYTNIVTTSAATTSAAASTASTQSSNLASSKTTSNLGNSEAQVSTPGFGVEGAFLAIALITSILAYSRVRRY